MVAVNHIEAHLYAALMSQPAPVNFPCLGVVLSGGHTALVLIREFGIYELIGQTVDDAVGEAFDKVAKMLGLPYPGGPPIEKLALNGDKAKHSFKGGQVKGSPLDFSFSGLKTAVLYAIKKADSSKPLSEEERADIAASFQRAALEDIVNKTLLAAKKFKIQTIIFGGGVTNNQALRLLFESQTGETYQFLWPSFGLSLDNAAMIAGLGYHLYQSKGPDSINLEAMARIPFQKQQN